MTKPKNWEDCAARTACRVIKEHDGQAVSNLPRELLRKRKISTISPNPPARTAVCDMQELMYLVAHWSFSLNGIPLDQLLHFHELPAGCYDKNGRLKRGGEKRTQYAELAYNKLIHTHAFFDAVDVMRAMGLVFSEAGSARSWLQHLVCQPGTPSHYLTKLNSLCPTMDVREIVIKAGKKAARHAPTPKERAALTTDFVKATQSTADVTKEATLNPRLSQNYFPYAFVATTANTIQHMFGAGLLSPHALAAAFQGCGAPTSALPTKRSRTHDITTDATPSTQKRSRVPLGGGPLMKNLLLRVEEGGAGKTLRVAAHVSRINCKSGSKHRVTVAPALNKAAIESGYVGTPAPSLEKENELLRRRQPHLQMTTFSYTVKPSSSDKPRCVTTTLTRPRACVCVHVLCIKGPPPITHAHNCVHE